MISFHAVRAAVLGTVAAGLFAGMAGSVQAAGVSGGGGEAPPTTAHPFGDSPNRKHDQNLAIGWDMLQHSGWANDSYGWNVSLTGRQADDSRDGDGHLRGANPPNGIDGPILPPCFMMNDVWKGSGKSPAASKDVDTISILRAHFVAPTVGYYEYILHYSGTMVDPNTGISTLDTDSTGGGIHSYAL